VKKKWIFLIAGVAAILVALGILGLFIPRPVETISRAEYQRSQAELKEDFSKELAENSLSQTTHIEASMNELTTRITESSSNQTASIIKALEDGLALLASKRQVEDLLEKIEEDLPQKSDLEELEEQIIAQFAGQGTQLTNQLIKLGQMIQILTSLQTLIEQLPYEFTPPYYQTQVFRVDVYNGENLDPSQYLTSFQEATIDHNWGSGGPAGLTDHYSVRWQGNIWSGGGNYQFDARADDGIRVWVDGKLIIDKWVTHVATTFRAELYLAPGYHNVRVEYFEREGQAVCRLTWQLKS
jgi:hypothetical protein